METQEVPTLLTVVETAERLRLSVGSVYTLIRSGLLPAVRVSERGLRVDAVDLADYLRERNGGA